MKDPVVIYSAKTSAETQSLGQLLKEAGIEAHIRVEESSTGFPMGGSIVPLEASQVWVDQADAERAADVVRQFEQTRPEREPEQTVGSSEPSFVTAICEECGESSLFEGNLVGSVQDCPHCGKFMDVAAVGDDLDWGDPEDDDTSSPEDE